MDLHEFLQRLDRDYNPSQCMIRQRAYGPGYHTRIPEGTPVHPTRETMDYAIALLQTHDPARSGRACDIIDKVTSLQVADSTAQHYGIWGWYLEEPPEAMNPADWNWADFIGARLAQALRCHAPQLRPDTLTAAQTALHHAALAILRRNVAASYTNIAIMGAVVAAAAAELLSIPSLLDYARTRLGNVLKLVEQAGGFPEYNSPTYTRVAIEETERALLLVNDPLIREHAERIRILAWQAFADHYHPSTGQIAGPCSRAYEDWITPALNRYFAQQTHRPIPLRPPATASPSEPSEPSEPPDDGHDIVPAIPCPSHLAPRFASLPSDPYQITTPFSDSPRGPIIGTTWFTQDACLGTVNRDICWQQRRPLLGYWRTSLDPAVCLRIRFLKDGQDYASAYIHQVQNSTHILGSLCLAYECGPFHPYFDRAPDSIHPAHDLRIRFSLSGRGVEARTLNAGQFALRAGDWQAVIHTPAEPCTLGQSPIRWQLTRPDTETDTVALDAILHEGPELRLDTRHTPLHLAFGLELLRLTDPIATTRPLGTPAPAGTTHWTWQSLSLESPDTPLQFCW